MGSVSDERFRGSVRYWISGNVRTAEPGHMGVLEGSDRRGMLGSCSEEIYAERSV